MNEPTAAIPTGGDSPQNLDTIPAAGELASHDPDTSNTLDKMFADAVKEKQEAEAPAPIEAPTPVETPAPVEAPAPVETPAPVEVKEKFEEVSAPPHTKPKTAEAIATIKLLARQALDAERTKVKELEAKLSAQEAASAKPLTPEVEAELTELRGFRQKLDVEADPQFKEWDAKIVANSEAILSRLKGAGISEETVNKIKEIGVRDVDWDVLSGKLPSDVRRYVDLKLAEADDLADKKVIAITAAKANATEFLKQRGETLTKRDEDFHQATKAELERVIPNLPGLIAKAAPKDATPEQRKAVEQHNAFVAEIQTDITECLKDNSPAMRGILIAGIAQLKLERANHAVFKASHGAEVAKLTKERDEATALVERIKKTSTSRLRESSAPQGDPARAPKSDLNEDGGSALDRHRNEILAGKE